MKSLRTLVVEDDADAREMLVELLATMGHHADAAAHANAALSALAETTFDIALIDVGLPGIDGLQLAKAIRDRVGQGMRLVALTGYDDEQTRKEATAAGFDTFMVKPLHTELLSLVLEQAVASQRDKPTQG